MSGRKNEGNANLVLLDGDFSGRDEMNLAGNPFALLQAASKNGQTFIRYEWERRLPNNKIVTASWEVSGHANLGLPGPNDELLYLVLLQLTREAADGGPWPQTVSFSRFDVLRRLNWPDTKQYYNLLRDCFARLQAVSIQADHSFWNARLKAPYESVGFHLIDDYAISAEPKGRKSGNALPFSWFKWSDTVHASLMAGNVRNLALEFTLSLDHPTSRRLFRLLDLFRHAEAGKTRREFTIGVMKLRDRLGMTGYKYASKVKEKLVSAHNELIQRGYLASVEYVKSKEGDELVVYRFGEINKSTQAPATATLSPTAEQPPSTPTPAQQDHINREVAYKVWQTLPDGEKERLRGLVREGVEPAFWDRLERVDSPMGLKLWELVAKEHSQAYEKRLLVG